MKNINRRSINIDIFFSFDTGLNVKAIICGAQFSQICTIFEMRKIEEKMIYDVNKRT